MPIMDSVPQAKVCTKCGKEFPATTEFFHRRKRGKYGLVAVCKACYNPPRRLHPPSYDPAPEGYKTCTKCKEAKPLSEFHIRRSLNRERTVCKACNKQYTRDWRAKHPEEAQDKTLRWRRDNPEAFRLSQRVHENKRRALKKNSKTSFRTEDVMLQMRAQTDKRGIVHCWWCNAPLDDHYHIDHRIPITKGGSNDASNIVLVHPRCNMSKSDKMPWEWNGRLL
jgi:formylmethanofuran dehydrogenase subunit E